MPPAHKREKYFDVSKLQSMLEPLTVRVEKLKNSGKSPVDLPLKDGSAPGTGFTREEVFKLESYVATELTGGGSYEASVTDANGVAMSWSFYYDPKMFPERAPPNAPVPLAAFMPPPPNPPIPLSPYQAAPQMPVGNPLGYAQTSWPPPGTIAAYPPSAQQYAGVPYFAPQAPAPQQQYRAPRDEAEDRVRAAELRVATLERETLERGYQQELEKQRLTNEQALTALREEMRRMSEAHRAVATENPEVAILRDKLVAAERQREADKLGVLETAIRTQQEQTREMFAKLSEHRPGDDQVKTLREEMARRDEALKSERERERGERERERAEDRHRLELAAVQTKVDQLIAQAAQPRGPDPMVEFLRESSRQAQETTKEIARSQQAQSDRLAAFMVNPLQLAQLIKDGAQGTDAALRTISTSFGDAFSVYRTAMESVVQATQGPAPNLVQTILEQGLGKGAEIVRDWADAKKATAESEARVAGARAQVARAQVDAYRAAGATPPRAGQQPVAKPPNGRPVAAAPDVPPASAPALAPIPAPASGGLDGASVTPLRATSALLPDAALFGQVWSAVQRLRMSVATGATTPEATVNAILTGVGLTQQEVRKLQAAGQVDVQTADLVPAFQLYEEERFAELFDALLPQAGREYRERCVQITMFKLGLADPPEDMPGDGSSDNSVQPQP